MTQPFVAPPVSFRLSNNPGKVHSQRRRNPPLQNPAARTRLHPVRYGMD
jgi:hypothetical protein